MKALSTIIPPPRQPNRPPAGWALTLPPPLIRLPEDYIKFVETYGLGCIGEFLYIFVPSAINPNLNLAEQYSRQALSLRTLNADTESRTPYLPHPQAGGLIPWGASDNGDILFWRAHSEDPETWTIVICDGRMTEWEEFEGGFAEYLGFILSGEHSSRILPDDFPEYGGLRFTPLYSGDQAS